MQAVHSIKKSARKTNNFLQRARKTNFTHRERVKGFVVDPFIAEPPRIVSDIALFLVEQRMCRSLLFYDLRIEPYNDSQGLEASTCKQPEMWARASFNPSPRAT